MAIQTLACPCVHDGTLNNDIPVSLGAETMIHVGRRADFPDFLGGTVCRSLFLFNHPGVTKQLVGAQLKLDILSAASPGMIVALFMITARAYDEVLEGFGTLAAPTEDGATWETFNGADDWDNPAILYIPTNGIYPPGAPGHDVNGGEGYSGAYNAPTSTGVHILDAEGLLVGLQDWITHRAGEFIIMLALSTNEGESKGFIAASRQHPTAAHPVLELLYSTPPMGRGRGRERGRGRWLCL